MDVGGECRVGGGECGGDAKGVNIKVNIKYS